eukprot:scaffold75178_cov46-Phaeocystis_antarctica.AAC.2
MACELLCSRSYTYYAEQAKRPRAHSLRHASLRSNPYPNPNPNPESDAQPNANPKTKSKPEPEPEPHP